MGSSGGWRFHVTRRGSEGVRPRGHVQYQQVSLPPRGLQTVDDGTVHYMDAAGSTTSHLECPRARKIPNRDALRQWARRCPSSSTYKRDGMHTDKVLAPCRVNPVGTPPYDVKASALVVVLDHTK